MTFEKLSETVSMSVRTHTPSKWVLVDLESREAWAWDNHLASWTRARGEHVRALREAAHSAPE